MVSSFYKNPQFPLVRSLDEIRQALFALIQPKWDGDEEVGGWELVDGTGTQLSVGSPAQLAISSIQQQLRHAQPEPYSGGGEGSGGRGVAPAGTSVEELKLQVEDAAGKVDATPSPAAEGYSWYRLDLLNRSITDDVKRDEVRALLVWLASKLDDDSLNHQLVTLKWELNAASSAQFAEDLRQRAKSLDAARCEIEADE